MRSVHARFIGRLAATTLLFASTLTAAEPSQERESFAYGDRFLRAKADERLYLHRLLDASTASHRPIRSGSWSDPQTWPLRRLPSDGAKVFIPKDMVVTVDSVQNAALDWIRVDGTLRFEPQASTLLRAKTIVVLDAGSFEMGTAATPIAPTVEARVSFVDRGPRDRVGDPKDLTGGFIARGRVSIHGGLGKPYVLTAGPLRAGTEVIRTREAIAHWGIGDPLIVPSTHWRHPDEQRRIAWIADDRMSLRLDEPLSRDHVALDGAAIPVANLRRNAVFSSEVSAPVERRAHFMLQHQQTGIVIDGAGFYWLGRTVAERPHTFPEVRHGELVEGSDDNTVGRYALHFHVRSGARIDLPPHVVRHCVIADSPKNGLVNHGGHVLAEENVTFDVAGTHFMSENGSELGELRGNVAIRSRGFFEPKLGVAASMTSRERIFDFGFGGHGYWMSGGGVRLHGNYAFGHFAAGYVFFTRPFVEKGRGIWFNPSNLDDPNLAERVLGWHRPFQPADVPLTFSGNVVAGSGSGIEVWYHQIRADHEARSRLEDSTIWGVKGNGLTLAYVRHLDVRGVVAKGDRYRLAAFGIKTNGVTTDISVADSRFEGFGIGVLAPRRGVNAIRDSYLRNLINLKVPSPNHLGRELEIADVTFGRSERAVWPQYDLELVREWPESGDLLPVFSPDSVSLVRGDRTHHVYYEEQAASARPFVGTDLADLEGLTSGEIWSRFGLAFGGRLAPPEARSNARTRGLIGPPRTAAEMAAQQWEGPYVHPDDRPRPHLIAAAGIAEAQSGWRLASQDERSKTDSPLVLVDATAPRLVVDPDLSPLIHPDDVRHGIHVCGYVEDRVGFQTQKYAFKRDFSDLVVGDDGVVRLQFEITDKAGNKSPVQLEFEVSEHAVRRGPNLTYFKSLATYGEQLAKTKGASPK